MLAANGKGGLATVALRPSGIFGEGDPLLVPLTVAKAKEGKMNFIIGSGKNLMDFTYVGNVAQAHLQVTGHPGHYPRTFLFSLCYWCWEGRRMWWMRLQQWPCTAQTSGASGSCQN